MRKHHLLWHIIFYLFYKSFPVCVTSQGLKCDRKQYKVGIFRRSSRYWIQFLFVSNKALASENEYRQRASELGWNSYSQSETSYSLLDTQWIESRNSCLKSFHMISISEMTCWKSGVVKCSNNSFKAVWEQGAEGNNWIWESRSNTEIK